MTMNEAGAPGIPDEFDGDIEELPHEEIAAVEQPEPPPPVNLHVPSVRHLAGGNSTTTVCGLPRAGQKTAHPSKAKKDDCVDCRAILRESMKAKMGPPATTTAPSAIARGVRVAFEDDSAWLVEDVRDGGMDLLCLVPSKAHAKGRRTTVSKDAFVRVLDAEGFSELVGREKPAKAEGIVSLPPRGDAGGNAEPAPAAAAPRATGKWAPTVAEVAEVRRLRALGRSYIAIEKEMGWPDGHGNRPWKIVKGTLKAAE